MGCNILGNNRVARGSRYLYILRCCSSVQYWGTLVWWIAIQDTCVLGSVLPKWTMMARHPDLWSCGSCDCRYGRIYPLVWISDVSRQVAEAAQSQLEWMAESVGKVGYKDSSIYVWAR
jgi:hypothetical protein